MSPNSAGMKACFRDSVLYSSRRYTGAWEVTAMVDLALFGAILIVPFLVFLLGDVVALFLIDRADSRSHTAHPPPV